MKILKLEPHRLEFIGKVSRLKNPKQGDIYIVYLPKLWAKDKFQKKIKVIIELEEDH